MNPTTKQVEALRNFKVPEEKIQAMSFDEATETLGQLIKRARSGMRTNRTANAKADEVLSQVRANLTDAAKIVMDHFGIRDKSELSEAHVALIQEMARQVYGLKYWLEKTSTRLD